MQNNNIFKQTIIKSLKDNEQLIYSKKINISINDINNFPLCEISDIKNIIDIDNNLVGIICFFDNRMNFYQNLLKNDKSTLSIFFPLSREKFILYCKTEIIKEEEKILNYWKTLNEEEKLLYETVDKDSIKPQLNIVDDLQKYTAQEKNFHSQNFSVVNFVPIIVEYTIFPMPQVIANLRRQKFESLLKPHKMPQKFLIKYIEDIKNWESQQLN